MSICCSNEYEERLVPPTTFARCCVRVATDPSLTLARRLVLYRDNRLRSGSAHTTSAVAPSTFVIPVPTTGIVVREPPSRPRRPGIRRLLAPYLRPTPHTPWLSVHPAHPQAHRPTGQAGRDRASGRTEGEQCYMLITQCPQLLAPSPRSNGQRRSTGAAGAAGAGWSASPGDLGQLPDQAVRRLRRLRRLAPSSSTFPREFPSTTADTTEWGTGGALIPHDDHHGLH